MRAAVISDTHDSVFSTEVVLEMIKKAGVDTIIHCGDMSYSSTAELFHDFCVYHAWGNNDIDTVGLMLAIRECKPGSHSERWIIMPRRYTVRRKNTSWMSRFPQICVSLLQGIWGRQVIRNDAKISCP